MSDDIKIAGMVWGPGAVVVQTSIGGVSLPPERCPVIRFEGDAEEKTFDMDGTEHIIPHSKCHCREARKCPQCFEPMHYQPVYGGYYYQCDNRHKNW